MDYLVGVVLVCVLSAVIFFDLRQMRIPNYLSLVLLGTFALLAITLAPIEAGMRIVQAAIIFTAGFLAFMFHLIGGGDVKILSALALFIPFEYVSAFMLVFAATLVFGTCAVLLCRHLANSEQTRWAFLKTAQMPMGLPIGLAGIIGIVAQNVI